MNRSVEVVHVIADAWPTMRSGVSTVVEGLLECGDAAGMHGSVLCPTRDVDKLEIRVGNFRRVGVPPVEMGERWTADSWVLENAQTSLIASGLQTLTPQCERVVVVDHINAGYLLAPIARSRGWAYVFYCHGTAVGIAAAMGVATRGPLSGSIVLESMRRERDACRSASVVVAVSMGVATELQSAYAGDWRVRVLPNCLTGVRRWSVRRRNCVRGPLRIVSMAGSEGRKNVEELLRAALCMPEMVPWTINVIGVREDLGATRVNVMLESHPSLRRRVRLWPFEPAPAFVRTWLNNADVVAITSKYEGCPMALLEAVAAGRPVVAARTPGTEEVMRELGLGEYLYEPGDHARLAELLMKAPSEVDRTLLSLDGSVFGDESRYAERWRSICEEAVTREGRGTTLPVSAGRCA